jgi:hypothetical protein
MAEKDDRAGVIGVKGRDAIAEFGGCGWGRGSFLVRRGMRELWEAGENEVIGAGKETFP